jgi:ribosomal protein S27AE
MKQEERKCERCGEIVIPEHVYHSGNGYEYYPQHVRGHYTFCPKCGVYFPGGIRRVSTDDNSYQCESKRRSILRNSNL